MLKNITHTFFFSNIFYGICAVALCIETNLLFHVSLNNIFFYFLIFSGTVFFYLLAYLYHQPIFILSERDIWYSSNHNLLQKIQFILRSLILLLIIFLLYRFSEQFRNISFIKFSQLLIFPVVAVAYSFNILPFHQTKNLRNIGWLKPFIIGFVWSGIVSIIPIIFLQLQYHNIANNLSTRALILHYLQNFFFISALCVLFDIKDFENDKQQNIKTFVVQLGISKTIHYIVIPLLFLTLLTTLQFNYTHHYTNFGKISLSIFPLFLTIIVSFKLTAKTHLLYYLWVIDGLMLVKAICSIILIKL